MHRGYVKLWRKAFDNGLHRNHKAWTLFTWIIGNVTHKEMDYIAGNQKIRLYPGQIVTGRKRLAEELAMSVQNIRTCLLLLGNVGFLTIKPTNKYSVLTVVNWAFYQSDACKVTNKPTSNQPATNQQLTTKQEQKNIRTKEKEKSGGEKTPPASFFGIEEKNAENQNDEKNGNFEKDEKNPPNEKNGIFDKTAKPEKLKKPLNELIEELKNRFPVYHSHTALQIEIREILEATRKGGKVADEVFFNFLDFCERHPVEHVIAGIRKFKDAGHAASGKSEKYLKGIIRNMTPAEAERTNRTPATVTIDYNENPGERRESFLEMNRRLWREQGKNY